MKHQGKAIWQGNLIEGKGTLSTKSNVLNKAPYSFQTRFENGKGTNPEELLAAAHAGCFTMALSAELSKVGITAEKLETNADVTLEKMGDGFAITKIHLDLHAKIPNVDQTTFGTAALAAKNGCPVSKLFKAEITLTTHLES